MAFSESVGFSANYLALAPLFSTELFEQTIQALLVPPNVGVLGGWGAVVSISTQATEVPTAAPLRLTVYRCGNGLIRIIDAHTAPQSAAEACYCVTG